MNDKLPRMKKAYHNDIEFKILVIKQMEKYSMKIHTTEGRNELRRECLLKTKTAINKFIPISADMRRFNEFIELFDRDTNYQFDRAGVYMLACLIPEEKRLLEFKSVAGKAGYMI